MCFGGGSSPPNNVKTPSYTPEQAYTAVVTEKVPAKKAADANGGLQDTTLAPAPKVASGLNLKGM